MSGFERTDSNIESSSTLDKMLPNRIVYYRKIIHKRKSQLIWQTSLMSYFKK